MSDVAIRAEGLAKKYVIGHAAMRETSTFRDTLVRSTKTFARKAGDLFHGRQIVQGDELEDVWALRDVSFDINRGEVVGIIGRNGAGKSTLLKILSRIIEPTAGRVHIAGRVASLLEVGTGFHPELTGRENIFLNGAILGMTRAEIRRKFDEIVAFAEVERFLDTPVKRYSSGMYVRLAFAVAAHLEPEILIVDEVLAVGDAEFQTKCLGRMREVSQAGRTVLFVSHNLPAVRLLCSRALLLQGGELVAEGTAPAMVDRYLSDAWRAQGTSSPKNEAVAHIKKIELIDARGQAVNSLVVGDPAKLRIVIDTKGESGLVFGVTLFNSEDIGLFSAISSDTLETIPSSTSAIELPIPTAILNQGAYRLEGALISDGRVLEQNECYCTFELHRTGRFDLAAGKSKGLLRFPDQWVFNEDAHVT
jgi:lipopolysaccharide transport system ATP-binding protein